MENLNTEEDSTWKEMKRYVKQDGFREGVSEGHKSTFQKGFDEGFLDGMKFGKLLGEVHGMLANTKNHTEKTNTPDSIESNCNICKQSKSEENRKAIPDSLYNVPYEEIKAAQKANDANAEELLRNQLGQLPAHK